MNDYYVYVYFRLNGIPCYIGKGRRFRWLEHERMGENHYNKHFAHIFKKSGGALPRVILRSCLTNAEAIVIEKALIAAIGCGKNGPLVNLTDGGDGTNGWKHSSGARKKISEAVAMRIITDETRAKLRSANLGKRGFKHSVEFCENLSRVHKGRTKTASECESIRRSKLGHVVSQETRDKIRAALVGRKLSPMSDEHRAKISASRTIRFSHQIMMEALSGEMSISAVAVKYGISRRTLNERVREAKGEEELARVRREMAA
jgi:hypothetical protein